MTHACKTAKTSHLLLNELREQRRPELLERALTHKSHAHEQNGDLNGAPHDTSGDNEQLEFLGDSILGFVASEYLVRLNPDHKLYQEFSSRVVEMRADPPGPGWDGVTAFKTK